MKIKPGVKLYGLRPEMSVVPTAVTMAYYELAGKGPTLTSVSEGTHKPKSLHKRGQAMDWRINDIPKHLWSSLRDRVELALGGPDGEFDVVLEKDHIHVEWDPVD